MGFAMLKRITLFLFMVFNLNIYSQVVIKDEIVLDEITEQERGTESINLVMPFYGRVYSEIPYQWNHWTSGAIKISRGAGNQLYQDGCCPPFVCGSGSCFCSWGTRAHNFYNVPQDDNIIVEIQRCYDPPPSPPNDYQWFDVPLQFTFVGNNRYDLYGQDLADQSWDYIGYLKFIQTTPTDCPKAEGNYCDDLFYIENPEFELLEHNSSYASHEKICDDPLDVAYTWLVNTPAAKVSNLYSFTDDSLMVCFNRNLQRWKFQLNPEKINLNVVIDLCYNMISNRGWTIINDTSDLNDIVNNNDCDLALQSFEGHKVYGYEIPDNGYLLREVVMLHEGIHSENYERYVQDYKYFLLQYNV